jgi:hypothetical protein
LGITGIFAKAIYPAFLLSFGFVLRFIIGLILTMFGVGALVTGVFQKALVFVYLSSVFISMGNVILYLVMLSFMKHFPSKYLTTYLTGSYCGGVFITVLYLFLDHFHLIFGYVSVLILLILR